MSEVVRIHPKESRIKDLKRGAESGRKQNLKRSERSFAFVVPRFGQEVGGAETLVRGIALKLAERGDAVHILTTCAKDNRTWENHFPSGEVHDQGMIVKRFPVDPRNLDLWIPHQISIHEGINPGIDAQLEWLEHSVNSAALYGHIAQFGDRYDTIFFAPYLFGTTFWGSQIKPERSVLIPCLHDENNAYLESMNAMFRAVRGCMFNAEPEKDLARRLYGNISGGEVGLGFEPFSEDYLSGLDPYLEEGIDYIIYVGRKETGKNAHKLIDDFVSAKESGALGSDLKLVFLGGGSFSDLFRPEALNRGDILDIGFLSERDKHRLIRHAKALCQPSRNESFSIVLMEAWLLGVPVLVDSQCQVTRHHVLQSNGGLYYDSAKEFAQVVNKLIENSDLGHALGEMGRAYVAKEYSWDGVLERFDRVLADLFTGS